jgi:hypothetical protein
LEILVLRHYYTTLAACSSYKRRVSWLEGDYDAVAVVEYTGVFPGHCPHGNAIKCSADYMKTPTVIMKKIGKSTGFKTPKEVYANLLRDSSPSAAPRNSKQVRAKMASVRQAKQGNEYNRANFADEMITVLNMVRTDDFVQRVIGDKGTTPQVILHFEAQMDMIASFCCDLQNGSVLTFDTTFNLSPNVYVTTCVLKHQALLRRSSAEEPIFLGPAFIHGHMNTACFTSFLSHLATRLKSVDTASITVGSDDDAALRSALTIAFPNSPHLVCSRHMEKNMTRHLADVLGVETQRRKQLVYKTFGSNG